MVLRRCSVWLLGAYLALPGIAYTDPLDLKALIEEALQANPSLRAFEHRVAAFEARVPRAGALKDPILILEARETFRYPGSISTVHLCRVK